MAARQFRFDRPYSPVEKMLHSVSHGIGAVLSLIGVVGLIIAASMAAHVDLWKIGSISVYGISLVLLYTASTCYHSARRPRARRLLKLCDHCAIYLLIAGTYTPFLLVNMRGPVGWALFATVWGLALGGIVLKLVWPQRYMILHVIVYLIMGWLIVVASGEMAAHLPTLSIALVVAGGIAYTVGVIFFAIRAIPFNHVIWHLFVIAGSACHYFAVYTAVVPFTA